MKKFMSLALLATFSLFFAGCEKEAITSNTTDLEETTTSNFRHQYTGAQMDQMIEDFTGKSAEGLSEDQKIRIMPKIRFQQLAEQRQVDGNSIQKSSNYWETFAITRLRPEATSPSSDFIYVDDFDFSTTGVQSLTADAGYSEPVPVEYFQIYSLAEVVNGNTVVDRNSQSPFNFVCNGEDFTFAVRCKARLLSSGSSYTQASLRCQD